MSDVSVRFVHLLSAEWGGGLGFEVLRLNCVCVSVQGFSNAGSLKKKKKSCSNWLAPLLE